MNETLDREWSTFDHIKESANLDYSKMLSGLRSKCPVGRSDMYGGFYVLTRHKDVVDAARDPRLSSAPERGPGPTLPVDTSGMLRMTMFHDDGDRHHELRMQSQRLLTPAHARSMESRIRVICDDLIDKFIESGHADLADQYSIEVPSILVGELLGLPVERRREFISWLMKMLTEDDAESLNKLIDYTNELYDLRSSAPGDDIPSQLLEFHVDGRRITREEWRGLVFLLIGGGLETTAHASSYILYMVGSDPKIRDHLLDDPSSIAQSIPEFIRMICPVPQHTRGVTEDVELGGHQFKQGDVVMLNWLAANHDPEVFEDPEAFRPGRKVVHATGFGSGPHMCLGRHLALVELTVMIERILARMPDFQLVEGGMQRAPSISRAVKKLMVTFTPGAVLSSAA